MFIKAGTRNQTFKELEDTKMTIKIGLQQNGSIYTINKNGTTYTAKDNDGDGKLTRKDGKIDGITNADWSSIESAQSQVSTPEKNNNKKNNNCASIPFQSGGNIWSYDTMYAGNTISYPTDALSASNDTSVWNYASSVANMPGMLSGMFSQMNAYMQKMENQNMLAYMEMMNSISSGTKTNKTDKEKTESKDEDERETISKEDLAAAKKENERLKAELEEMKKVRSHRDTLKDTSSFDASVERIAEKLRNKMKGWNISSIFGNVGNDKAVADTVNEIKPENVVEVMEYYKKNICDKNRMGDDFNLIESIYDDFTDEKYTTKIAAIENALVARAQALIDKYGENTAITPEDIAQFKSDVAANLDADGYHITGDSTPIATTFENFKVLLQNAEGGVDKVIVKKPESATTEAPVSQSTSETQTEAEKEKEKK